jgi:hypothetical protein
MPSHTKKMSKNAAYEPSADASAHPPIATQTSVLACKVQDSSSNAAILCWVGNYNK